MKIIFALLALSIICSNATAESCIRLVFGGEEILCFSKGIGPFNAQQRVSGIATQLERLAEDKTFDTKKIAVQEVDESSVIGAEEVILTTVREIDITESEIGNRQRVALDIAQRMRSAIENERRAKSPAQLWQGIGFALAATLALVLLLFALGKFFERLYVFIGQSEGRIIRSIQINSYEILNASRIIAILLWGARVTRLILTVVLFYIYVPLVMSFFPWTANLTPKLYGYIWDPLVHVGTKALDFLPNLFFIITIGVVTVYVLKVIRFLFREIEAGTLKIEGFYRDWAEPTYKLTRVLVVAFGFIMAFPYIPGSNSPAFQGVSVFLGLLISLGSSSAVANIIAGVVITYMRPFKKGDRVRIAETTGDIIEKNLLVTRMRSVKNVEITIPNAMVLGSHIVNYSATAENEGLILNTTVTIGYDVPWRKVHELLISAAEASEGISTQKKPFVLQTALNDFYVAYELNAHTNLPNQMSVLYSRLHQNIQDKFNEAGVEILSPHYGAHRDGNEVTIPADHRSPDYKIPSFRVGVEVEK